MRLSCIFIMFSLAELSYAVPQGLNPICPPCEERASFTPKGSPVLDRVSSLFSQIPADIHTPREALNYVRSKVVDKDVYTYVAQETLRELDRVIDDTVEVSNKFTILAELVAGHLLDKIIPGGSVLIDGMKFIISLFKSNASQKLEYKTLLDPKVQAELVAGIANMLKEYEVANPGCLKDSELHNSKLSLSNFLHHEGVCPMSFKMPEDEPDVTLVDVRLKVPVDFSRANFKDLLIRGPYSLTFGGRFTMSMNGMYSDDYTRAFGMLIYLFYQATVAKEIPTYNVVGNINVQDVSMLDKDRYAHCLLDSLLFQMQMGALKVFYGSFITYEPSTFSHSQIAVKRLQCFPDPPLGGCTARICHRSRTYFEYISSLTTIIPNEFAGYPGHIRVRRNGSSEHYDKHSPRFKSWGRRQNSKGFTPNLP